MINAQRMQKEKGSVRYTEYIANGSVAFTQRSFKVNKSNPGRHSIPRCTGVSLWGKEILTLYRTLGAISSHLVLYLGANWQENNSKIEISLLKIWERAIIAK